MYTFSKIERLCSKKAIDVLFSKGKSINQFPIKLIYIESEFEGEFPIRTMFVVPKKKHKRANKRNLLKRRMREVYRLQKHTLYSKLENKKYDIMYIMLSNELIEYAEIEKKITSLNEKFITAVS